MSVPATAFARLGPAPAAQRPWIPILALAVLTGLVSPGPTYAVVHGGVEIGAKGVKAVVLDETGGAEGIDAKVLRNTTKNTTLVAGLAKSGRFSPEALKETVAAVAQFVTQIRKEYQVPDERIYVVGSSGLFSAVAGKDDLIRVNREALAAAVKQAAGLTMRFVDAAREAELSIVGSVPSQYVATSILIDIGSGNTKGGMREDGNRSVTFEILYGTVTFTDLAKMRAGKSGLSKSAAALRDEILLPALKEQLRGKTAMLKRERVYLSGGIVWALATLVHPQNRSTYVPIATRDIERFQKMLLQEPSMVPTPDLSKIADPEVRKSAQKEIEQVKKVFTADNLLAGSEILKALSTTFEFERDGKRIYFARNAYISWIMAYVVEKSKVAP